LMPLCPSQAQPLKKVYRTLRLSIIHPRATTPALALPEAHVTSFAPSAKFSTPHRCLSPPLSARSVAFTFYFDRSVNRVSYPPELLWPAWRHRLLAASLLVFFPPPGSRIFGHMNDTKRINIKPGIRVDIVLKEDQRTGKLTRGIVKDVLTNSATHPHGIKVRLQDGKVGRVKTIIEQKT